MTAGYKYLMEVGKYRLSPAADQMSKNDWRTIAPSAAIVLARVAEDSDTMDGLAQQLTIFKATNNV
jgi:hypothetical protein